jgi:hypothetical protein
MFMSNHLIGFGAFQGEVAPTTVIIDTANGSQNMTGFTFASLTMALVTGATISKIGIYNTVGSITLEPKIVKRNSPGNFDIVVENSNLSHTGSGWEDLTLGSPYVVPAGSYYLACYIASGTISVQTSASRAYIAGDGTGTGQSFTEDTSGVPSMRYTYT